MKTVSLLLELLGALGVFLVGMKLMSEGLQKVAGKQLKAMIGAVTGNRFSGVLTGVVVTCVVQSSSATTVMVVSFVTAGLLSLTQAIGVVMGANIGTTLTGWLVALLGFKVKVTTGSSHRRGAHRHGSSSCRRRRSKPRPDRRSRDRRRTRWSRDRTRRPPARSARRSGRRPEHRGQPMPAASPWA